MSDCCILHIILLYIIKPISLRRIQENTKDEYKRDIYTFTFKKNLWQISYKQPHRGLKNKSIPITHFSTILTQIIHLYF